MSSSRRAVNKEESKYLIINGYIAARLKRESTGRDLNIISIQLRDEAPSLGTGIYSVARILGR